MREVERGGVPIDPQRRESYAVKGMLGARGWTEEGVEWGVPAGAGTCVLTWSRRAWGRSA